MRALGRKPAFSIVAVLTLTLGVAATVSVFALVYGIVIRQLPFPEAQHLVQIDHSAPGFDLDRMGISDQLYLHYLESGGVFQELALYSNGEATLTRDGEPEKVPYAVVTPSLFRLLRVSPDRGRFFTEEEGLPGSASPVMLSHELWQRRYGGQADILGRSVEVDGVSRQVVGVMPASFSFPDPRVELWIPRVTDPAQASIGSFNDTAIGRLGEGVSLAAAHSSLSHLTANLAESFPEDRAAALLVQGGFGPRLMTHLEFVTGGVRGVLWLLLAAVLLILAIASANVANLFLVRIEERRDELAIRSALGASRGRLIRTLLAESTLLGLLAGLFGIALAWGVLRLIVHLGPGNLPRLEEVSLAGAPLIFGLLTALTSGLLLGWLPAWRGTRGMGLDSLKGSRASAGRGRQRLRYALVAIQMALGLVLLTACGLVIRSLQELRQVEPGFRPEGGLTFQVSLPANAYPELADRIRFYEEAQRRLAGLPGVSAAVMVDSLPLGNNRNGTGYQVEDFPLQEGELPPIFMRAHVAPDYLEHLGVPLLAGRRLTEADYRSGRNIVISRSIAERLWPEGSALGKRMTGGNPERMGWQTVVGVVEDAHYFGLDEPTPDMVYLPLALQNENADGPWGIGRTFSFLLRTETPPEQLAAGIRSEIWAMNPDLPIARIRSLEDLLRDSRARMAFTTTLLSVASALALLIAAIGLYGVISYLVSRRLPEIGIRMALGAQGVDIRRMVLRQGMKVAVAGAAVGLVLALLSTRFFHSVLFGVSSVDPLTFAIVPLVLLAVAAGATFLPALKASRLDPQRALRQD